MIEQAFGSSLTIGVEEELWILDADTLELVPAVEQLVSGAEGRRNLPGVLKTELHASVVELTSGIGETAEEAVERLRELRRAAREIAEENGLRVGASGSYPTSIPGEQEIAPADRYREFVAYAGPSARRQGVSGLHVHVGMPDADTCLRVMELVLPWLPLVLALSANSPWFEGQRTGLMSTRAEILGLLPRRGAPPHFASWGDWEELVDTFVRSGVASGYMALHWDVRPHPRFGTLEIRAPDQPTALDRTSRFVELMHALCRWALQEPARKPLSRAIYEQNRWAASRYGPRAQLIHPLDSGAVAAPDLYRELVELIGHDAGLDPATCEGDRQLEFEGPEAATADLVERSI